MKITTTTNESLKAITDQLENGVHEIFQSGRYAEYLDVMARFHNYSVNNSILILMQYPNASRVAGFNTWKKDFDRFVKKGEKGIKILAPCPHKITVTKTDEDGNEEEVERQYTTFRPVTVFDVSQTDGKELPALTSMLTGSVEDYAALLQKLQKAAPVPVRFEDIRDGSNGYYSLDKKEIVIKTGMSEQQTVKTTVHEIAHSMLHCENGDQEKVDRETKEVQAESVAYTVCKALGIDSDDYSFGYVVGWSKGKEAKELTDSLETIRKAARLILDMIAA